MGKRVLPPITLQPKQGNLLDLWEDPITTRIGFGGARGGAKSGGGRRCMLVRRRDHPGTVGLILRRTYPELYKSHLLKLFQEYPRTRDWYSGEHKVLSFPNGSKLFFGYAEHESDMGAFYSAEFDDVLVDEAQEFSQGELERLSGSIRSTKLSITPKMVFSFMPGVSESGLPPKGLPYLRRVFIDKIHKENELEHRWDFIQAFSWDNYEWMKKELTAEGVSAKQFYTWDEATRRDYFLTRKPDFAKQLLSMSKSLRDAWLYGKWDTFEGQYFQQPLQIVPPQDIRIEPWHTRWMSGDWGSEHPSCYYWHTMDGDGVITTYRELWRRGVSEPEMGREISRLNGNEELKGFWLSWDAFGRLDKKTKQPITKLLNDHLSDIIPRPTPVDATPGSRISGWRWMSALLDQKKWRISAQCEKLIECLPTLVRDMERNSEDVLKVDYSENYIGDDPADAARYGLQNALTTGPEPFNSRLTKALDAQPDYTKKHMLHLQMQEKEEQRTTTIYHPAARGVWRGRRV